MVRSVIYGGRILGCVHKPDLKYFPHRVHRQQDPQTELKPELESIFGFGILRFNNNNNNNNNNTRIYIAPFL